MKKYSTFVVYTVPVCAQVYDILYSVCLLIVFNLNILYIDIRFFQC